MKNIRIIHVLACAFLLTGAGSTLQARKADMLAGIARVDITPEENLVMGGYDATCRFGPSEGHEGQIYIRALVLDDNQFKLAFIELDVVSLPEQNYDRIRTLISEQTGITFDGILLGCVHNHAAPYPGGSNEASRWNRELNGKIVKAVKNAMADLEPVMIGAGMGRSNIAMNRRKRMTDTLTYLTFDENNSSQSYGKYKTDRPVRIREIDGVYRLGSNPGGSIDDQIGILRFDRMSGEPKAVLINYACHGTTLGGRNNLISPEWNGYMLDYVEKSFPGVTGIFIQGAAGDINPRFVGGLEGRLDNHEKTAKLGQEIGNEVINTFRSIKTERTGDYSIRLVRENIICPLKYDYVVKDFHHTTVPVPVTAVKIDKFVFVTFPGELFHEIGQHIKFATHASYPFFVGYTNGNLGYLPTQEAYSQGGYEPWSSRFAPVTEKILVDGVQQMLMKLY